MIHTRYGLDFGELKDMCKGKIAWRKCPDCDVEGQQYWDGETGLGVSSTPSGINPEWLEAGSCETCYGLGYHLYYV